jgi:citrate synthase
MKNRVELENAVDNPMSLVGVISASFTDLKLIGEQGEMLYLLLRLPGAAVHALEQQSLGIRNFPFFINGLNVTNDPKIN